jgi:hypothetical protein
MCGDDAAADVDQDGTVHVADLLAVIQAWGGCDLIDQEPGAIVLLRWASPPDPARVERSVLARQ